MYRILESDHLGPYERGGRSRIIDHWKMDCGHADQTELSTDQVKGQSSISHLYLWQCSYFINNIDFTHTLKQSIKQPNHTGRQTFISVLSKISNNYPHSSITAIDVVSNNFFELQMWDSSLLNFASGQHYVILSHHNICRQLGKWTTRSHT
jgi:hypothetical protein